VRQPNAKLLRINTPLAPADFAHIADGIPSGMSLSMLDGYLAAVATGPNFAMPDQVLRWVWSAGRADDLATDLAKHLATDLLIRHYQAVNDALNDQVYVPLTTDPQAWCRGYLDGFAADMISWTPLLMALPDSLSVILSVAGGQRRDAERPLADAARLIHAFWVNQRRYGSNQDGLLGQLATLSHTPLLHTHAALPIQRLH